MSAYSAASEETLFDRNLLKDWADQGFLTSEQYQRMEEETRCPLRRTNIFLRLVLFFFTAVMVGAAVILFFVVFPALTPQTGGVVFLVFAALSYAGAEFAVGRGLYRYGIEEALSVCSVALLCAGLWSLLSADKGIEFLVPTAGVIASLWIWHRFGLTYAFPAAMVFVPWISGCWSSSHSVQHLIVAAIYTAGLVAVVLFRPRECATYLNQRYSIVEALLWLGIYLAFNLHLSSVDLLRPWLDNPGPIGGFSRTFYWSTWVLTWCIPSAALVRGLRRKDRIVVGAGSIAAVLTLVTNKPYLGWPRHTWDPMLLGGLLIGIAFFMNRWLANGPGGMRHGFTARRLSGKDQSWMNAVSTAFGLTSPYALPHSAPAPQTSGSDTRFGGGDAGGGGASSNF